MILRYSIKIKILLYFPLVLFFVISLIYFSPTAEAADVCTWWLPPTGVLGNCAANSPGLGTNADLSKCADPKPSTCDSGFCLCCCKPETPASSSGLNASMPKLNIPDVKLQITIPGLNLTKGNAINCPEVNGKRTCNIPWIGEYIAGIYKYAIGIVGILAAVVLMIGGVMWIIAGGSATMIGEAKSWIGASLTGLVIALCSYLILYQINPALTIFRPLGITQVAKAPKAATVAGCSWQVALANNCTSGTKKVDANCTSAKPSDGSTYVCCCPKLTTGTGGCAEANFNGTCFAADSAKAACICQKESGGLDIESGTDRCIDGTSWSIGLWQINLASAGSLLPKSKCGETVDKGGITTGGTTPLLEAGGKTCLDSNTSLGCCLERKTGSNGINYCSIRNCKKTPGGFYDTCSAYLKDSTNNKFIACEKYNNGGWTHWANSASLCQ